MSGIEKQCRLSLALDRVYRHGDMFLNEGLQANRPLVNAILALQHEVSKIENWDDFIESESSWWVDLKDEKE